ncbi:hypothetical protein SEVIR_5G132564v4 [Setaria viridis]|uniref:Uncharacterized protein n=1 Tax=Setaria viridis TaxID=4556 RepID=A0A4U6UD46_SETVI|nr:hypothetical protein SEVIR_5G132564v2 [Setaria viridis]
MHGWNLITSSWLQVRRPPGGRLHTSTLQVARANTRAALRSDQPGNHHAAPSSYPRYANASPPRSARPASLWLAAGRPQLPLLFVNAFARGVVGQAAFAGLGTHRERAGGGRDLAAGQRHECMIGWLHAASATSHAHGGRVSFTFASVAGASGSAPATAGAEFVWLR